MSLRHPIFLCPPSRRPPLEPPDSLGTLEVSRLEAPSRLFSNSSGVAQQAPLWGRRGSQAKCNTLARFQSRNEPWVAADLQSDVHGNSFHLDILAPLNEEGRGTLNGQEASKGSGGTWPLIEALRGKFRSSSGSTKGAGGSTHCQDNMLPRRECFLRIERALHRFCHKPSEGLARSVVLSHHSRAKVLRSLLKA